MKDKQKNFKLKQRKEAKEAQSNKQAQELYPDSDASDFYEDEVDKFHKENTEIKLSSEYEGIHYKEKTDIQPLSQDPAFADDKFSALFVDRLDNPSNFKYDIPNADAWGKKKVAYYGSNKKDVTNFNIAFRNPQEFEEAEARVKAYREECGNEPVLLNFPTVCSDSEDDEPRSPRVRPAECPMKGYELRKKKSKNVLKNFTTDPFQPKRNETDEESEDEAPKKKKQKVQAAPQPEKLFPNHPGLAHIAERYKNYVKPTKEQMNAPLPKYIQNFKGIVPYRKRDIKNPRVHNRKKYRKAVIRSKGAVRPMRSRDRLYEGETTGINSYLVRSRKLN